MKHYTYQHIRLDTNEIFYIGIGTKSSRAYNTIKSKYYRAYTRKGRNIVWKRIVSKTEYKVEIIYESNSYNDVKEEEKRLIKLYGRKSYYGTLCNLTEGGDGLLGYLKPRSLNSPFSKKIYQYELNGKFKKEWECGKDIERELSYSSNCIYNCCNKKKKNNTAYGYQWSYILEDLQPIKKHFKSSKKSIIQLDINGYPIKEWKSATEASKKLNIPSCHISACCLKRKYRNTAGGFKWIFKN